ncbi:MAG: hypothetical protein IJF80_03350 [Clostridia bacterium]|nr:hypothetical protein [Clostridia bacterium]
MKTLTKTTIVILSAVMLFACIGNFIKPLVTNAGLTGDINEDGIVNSKDLSMLQKIILGQYKAEETEEPFQTPSVDTEPPEQRRFETVEKFMEWAAQKEDRYERISKFYEGLEKDGGVYVPYYDGKPMEFDKIEESTYVLMTRESDFSYGYDYYGIENVDGKGTEILVYVNLANTRGTLKDSFLGDREVPQEDWEKYGYQEIVTNVGGEDTEVIFKPHNEVDGNERAFFFCEDSVVMILFYSKDTENNLEILEKISFDKVLFEEIEK